MASDILHPDMIIDVKQAPVTSLIAAHTAIVNELLFRHLGHNRTSPTADLPELLVAEAYDGEHAGGQQGWNVEAGGRRLLVRGRMRLPTDRPTATYSPITGWDFDAGVFIVIDAVGCQIVTAVELPVEQIRSLVGPSLTKTPGRIRIADDLMSLHNARDVSTEIEKALAKLDSERFARRHSDESASSDAAASSTGLCGCGCGKRTDPGARFLVMHDRRAGSPAVHGNYGTISGLVVT